MTDTDPRIEQLFIRMIMSKTGEERLRMGFEMYDTARKFVAASISAPEGSADFLQALFLRFYDTDLPQQFKQNFITKLQKNKT
jgi:hypothetical protein